MEKRIDDFLSASHRTRRLTNLSLGWGRQLAIWMNSHDEVQYSATKGHVFSLYLNGGGGTSRIDGRGKMGRPGALCIFPEGHSSTWRITEAFQFMHLYVTDEVLRAAFAKTHDQDARRLDISERILIAPGGLEGPLRQMAQASLDGDVFAADVGFSDMVAALTDQPVLLSGGLSQKTIRDVIEWVDANLETNIRLNDLANLAGLSDFHFHRMFRQTCGLSPHNWLTQFRIARAKTLLVNMPTIEVALACGFSSQSHFIRRFKEQVGVTPGRYLRMVPSAKLANPDQSVVDFALTSQQRGGNRGQLQRPDTRTPRMF